MRNLFLGIILTLPLWVEARDCDYNMSVSNAVITIEDEEQVIQREAYLSRSQSSNDGRCRNYRIYFSKGLSNSYQRRAFSLLGRSIQYNLHSQINKSAILKDINDALNPNERVEGMALDRNTTYPSSFFVSVPGTDSQNYPLAGIYYDNLQLSLYAQPGNSGNFTFEETDNFTITFVVPKRLEVSLIEEGGSFDASSTSKVLDFGNITQSQERGADLRVLSNAYYEVRVSSQNAGVLKHNSGNSVSYNLKVNGSPVYLGVSSVKIGSGGATSSSGDRYNFRVQVNPASEDRPAGLYQDVITITAVAN